MREDDPSLKDPITAAIMAALVSRFEATRLPRVREIWNDEWEWSESAYTGKRKGPATKEYTE